MKFSFETAYKNVVNLISSLSWQRKSRGTKKNSYNFHQQKIKRNIADIHDKKAIGNCISYKG